MSTKRAELAFLAVRGCSAAAFFLLVPFLALWLIDARGLSGTAAATVVALCLLFGRAGGMVAARFLDRLGLKRSVVLAYLTATATVCAMALYPGDRLAVWALLASLLGLSFSSATAALKALVIVAYTPEQRLWAFSKLNLAVNAGSAAGIAAGGYIAAESPQLLMWTGVLLYGAAAAALRLVPPVDEAPAGGGTDEPARGGPLPFAVFLGFTAITWIAYAQVFNVLPTFTADTVGTEAVSYLFVLNSAMVIVLQTPLTAWLERWRRARPRLAALTVLPGAHAAVSLSVVLFGFTGHAPLAVAYAAMAVFTLAELVFGPAYDAEVAEVKGRLSGVAAYGVAGAVRGGAESAGTWLGIAAATAPSLAWPATGAVFWAPAAGLVLVAGHFLWRASRDAAPAREEAVPRRG
ncbi:MFS transporter [Glycomyces arizonensis]|uniref:MFS transporter n=1 Tax=Glycomyces arizonensis TaxID=256035 RepID=UPI000429E1F7|nr:MFS transporter [Glycomyces arizonensis]